MSAKVTVKKDLFCLPWTQTILGTHFEGRPNFMALDWVTRVNYQPALLGLCVNKGHASNEAIRATGELSVNVPTVDMVAETDCTGLVSGRKVDKSKLFDVHYGELKAAPLITACPLNIECKVVQSVELPTNTLFIAEIVNIYCREDFLLEGAPDYEKIKPFLLSMPDNRFWALGQVVGRAWHDGAKVRERLK